MATELVPIDPEPAPPATLPVRPAVGPGDLYGALLADAKKATTRRAREQDLRDLARFLKVPGPREACIALVAGGAAGCNAIAAAYLAEMIDRKLAPATANRRISTLRRACKVARKYRVIDWTPEADTLRVESYRDTSGPGHAGWLRLLEEATRAAELGPKGRRDLAILRLLHDRGLRREEVETLDLAHLELDAGRAWVMRKGRSERKPLTLNRETVLALSRWIEARGAGPGPLFVRLDRARPAGGLGRLQGDGIHKLIRALGDAAALAKPVRPHGLRHEAITRILELTNGNLDAAQKFADHLDPKVTQRYNDNRKDVAGDMTRLLGSDG